MSENEIKLNAELEKAKIRIERGRSAAFFALLEMSAWLGIPEKKRMTQVRNYMSNVNFCLDMDIENETK